MSSPLARAHIVAQERLRKIATDGVAGTWRALPAYDERNVDQWLREVLPLMDAAQRQSVSLTDAFIARALGRPALGLDPARLTGPAVRAGATPAEVYTRPFVTVWTSLKGGALYDAAVAAGLARAVGTAAMDVQLSMRATLTAAAEVEPAITGYQRVADAGACAYCQAIDGAKVNAADPMPLHNGCGCGVDVLTEPFAPSSPPEDVAVNAHGELGPVLGSPEHDFTSL